MEQIAHRFRAVKNKCMALKKKKKAQAHKEKQY